MIKEDIIRAEEELARKINEEINKEDAEMEAIEDDTYEKAVKRQRKRLWTDKYQSRNFLDLMSDDLSNRKCMNWVKSWDDIVFNREGKIVAPTFIKNFKKPFLFNNYNKKPITKTLEEENTRHNKPVLMLNGLSGTGKSTMARVIAKHCGYQV